MIPLLRERLHGGTCDPCEDADGHFVIPLLRERLHGGPVEPALTAVPIIVIPLLRERLHLGVRREFQAADSGQGVIPLLRERLHGGVRITATSAIRRIARDSAPGGAAPLRHRAGAAARARAAAGFRSSGSGSIGGEQTELIAHVLSVSSLCFFGRGPVVATPSAGTTTTCGLTPAQLSRE